MHRLQPRGSAARPRSRPGDGRRRGPVAGASVHLDNRARITQPQTTLGDGVAVLLVYLGSQRTDTGTVTVVPPAGYDAPVPQAVTVVADETLSVSFSLQSH